MHRLDREYEVTITGVPNRNEPTKYTETLKKVCTLKYAEELSYILHHIKSFDDAPSFNINIFRKGVGASWEDPDNINGCSWVTNFRVDISNILFERLCTYFCLVGFKTFQCNGIKVNVRKRSVKFEVWSANVPSVVENSDVLEDLQKSVGLDFPISFSYKNHKEVLDKIATPTIPNDEQGIHIE